MSTTFRRTRGGLYIPRGHSWDAEVLADSPALWLRLDETGSTAVDSSGNGRNGTHTNVTQNQPSMRTDGFGKSMTYNGTNAYTAIPTAAWMTSVSLTVEARVIRNGAVNQFIAGRWGTGTGSHRPWLLYINSAGRVVGQLNSSGAADVTGTTVLSSVSPTTIALRTNGSTVDVYLNGVLDGSSPHGGPDPTRNIDDIEIARASLVAYSPVKVDELVYYTSALTGARLAAHHAAA